MLRIAGTSRIHRVFRSVDHCQKLGLWFVRVHHVQFQQVASCCSFTTMSSEGEDFDFNNISDSDSDGYAPVKVLYLLLIGLSDSRRFPSPKPPSQLQQNLKPQQKQPRSPRQRQRRRFLPTTMTTPRTEWMLTTTTSATTPAPLRTRQVLRNRQLDLQRQRQHPKNIQRFALDALLSILTRFQLSQIEHILKRPDSYIGSVELHTQAMWTFDPDTKRMVHREVSYVPGFFKIVDEILVNAADNKVSLICLLLTP